MFISIPVGALALAGFLFLVVPNWTEAGVGLMTDGSTLKVKREGGGEEIKKNKKIII